MIHQVLVQRAARGDVDRGCGAAPATRPADLLPGAGDRARIAAQDRGIEMTDVDPELQGVGTDDTSHRSIAQTVFDLASLQRQIPAAIAANRACLTETICQRLLQVAEQDLDLQPRPAEDDRLHAGAQEGLGDALAFKGRRAANAELAIDDGRVVEEQALGASGRAVVVNERDWSAG